MNHIRTYKIIIIILILLNAGTLSFLWIGRLRPFETESRGQSARFLIRELKLTPEQRDEFGRLREVHRGQLLELQEQDRILHDRFFEFVFIDQPDTAAMKALTDSVANLRKKMEILTYQHFRNLRRLLNKEQEDKFRAIFNQALEKTMPLPEVPGVPPPPPPPPARHKR